MKKTTKKLLPGAIALIVIAFFVLPGLAFAGKGGGTPSPPPSNPPCDADGHNGQPPPYNGPNQNGGSCDNGTTGNSGNTNGESTGNACPPKSPHPDHQPPPGCGQTGNPTTGNPTTGNPTGNPTTGNPGGPTTGGPAVCGEQLDHLPIFLHVGGAPDADTGQLLHVCAQVGGKQAPTEPCPKPPPIEIRPNSSDPSLAVCVLL